MSGANASRTLPPGDRDDAPELPIARPHGNYPHPMDDKTGFGPHTDEEMGLTPEPHDDAPPLTDETDETDEARLARLTRHQTEATKHVLEAMRLLAAGKHQTYAAAMHRCATDLTEAASLARVLSKSFTAKR